jgi:hypothetical protein
VPFDDVLGTLSVLQADAVARDRALVPILDFAQDTLQITATNLAPLPVS